MRRYSLSQGSIAGLGMGVCQKHCPDYFTVRSPVTLLLHLPLCCFRIAETSAMLPAYTRCHMRWMTGLRQHFTKLCIS